MKKIFALFLALMLAACFTLSTVGCKKQEEQKPPSGTETPAAPEKAPAAPGGTTSESPGSTPGSSPSGTGPTSPPAGGGTSDGQK